MLIYSYIYSTFADTEKNISHLKTHKSFMLKKYLFGVFVSYQGNFFKINVSA